MTSCCRRYLRSADSATGMGACPGCSRQWYFFAPGWAKRWGSNRVYHLGTFAGLHEEYGDLRRMMTAKAEVQA